MSSALDYIIRLSQSSMSFSNQRAAAAEISRKTSQNMDQPRLHGASRHIEMSFFANQPQPQAAPLQADQPFIKPKSQTSQTTKAKQETSWDPSLVMENLQNAEIENSSIMNLTAASRDWVNYCSFGSKETPVNYDQSLWVQDLSIDSLLETFLKNNNSRYLLDNQNFGLRCQEPSESYQDIPSDEPPLLLLH